MTRRAATLTVASLLLVVLVSAAFLLPVPYVTLQPGPTLDTLATTAGKPLIGFGPGVKTYPTTGSLALTTVSVTRPDAKVGLAQAFQAWFDGDSAILPRDLIYPPDQTVAQSQQQTQAQMSGSQLTSEVAGLTAAGYQVPAYVRVTSVTSDGPAAGVLQPGDRVRSVDGTPVTTPEDVVKAVTARKPGDTVTLGIERNGAQRSVRVTTVADPQNASLPRVGIGLGAGYDFPVNVVYNVSSRIGGPSAGTMFALAIYDKLTPGSLTGGQSVAGTGEIAADGTVGPIGGIQQKMAAAQDAGATVFLAPAANCAEALGADVNFVQLRLVKITSLSQAISSLEAIDQNRNANVPTCG